MPPGGSQSPRRRKLYERAKSIGLTREERIDLAQILLRRDITSWKQLDEAQVVRMLDAIEAAELILELMRQKGQIIDL